MNGSSRLGKNRRRGSNQAEQACRDERQARGSRCFFGARQTILSERGWGRSLEGMGRSYRHPPLVVDRRRRAAQLAVLKPEICAERG